MKAITILQPWASLLLTGPRLETAPWGTDYRGPFAVHAGLVPFKGNAMFTHEFVIRAAAAFRVKADHLLSHISTLPLGAVIGEAELTDCRQIVGSRYLHGARAVVELSGAGGRSRTIDGLDAVLGNFGEGRYVWFVQNGSAYEQAITSRGRRGLWEWERP